MSQASTWPKGSRARATIAHPSTLRWRRKVTVTPYHRHDEEHGTNQGAALTDPEIDSLISETGQGLLDAALPLRHMPVIDVSI